jgi:Transposase.
MNWHEQPHFAALDWARDHHDFVVIDRQGVVIEKLRFEHDEAGWRRLGLLVDKYRNLPVAVETSHGTVVENLFAAGVKVFPINPKAAERYRERHAPSGVKNDLRDAWSLADALRLGRAHVAAVAAARSRTQRVAITLPRRNRSHRGNAPNWSTSSGKPCTNTILSRCRPLTIGRLRSPRAFVVRFPTPQALHSAGSRRWESFMRQQRVWRPTTVQATNHPFRSSHVVLRNAIDGRREKPARSEPGAAASGARKAARYLS